MQQAPLTPKTIIFDFDGTLADSFGVAMNVFHQLTGGKHELSAAEIAALRGLPARQVIRRLGIPLWRVPFLVTKGRKLMHAHIDELLPFAGLPQAIAVLHSRGYRMFIVSSNSAENISRFLEAHGMTGFFEGIYGGVGLFSKAKFMRRMLRANHIQPAECVYVGDEARDMHAAQRVGIASLAVAWGYNSREGLEASNPTALIGEPAELPAFFGV